MELQQLKYFKTVASIGKISEAAQTLFVSAPALSTCISRLEKELGMQLFDRTNNRITLNAQGQIFLKYTDQIFASIDGAKRELRESLLQQNPRISLVSINTAMWVNLTAAFMAEFPQYTLSWSSMSLSQLAQNGISPEHSFLLAYDSDIPPAYEDKLRSSFLFQISPMVAIHKDHPLAKEEMLTLPMLAEEKLLMPIPGYPLHKRLEQLFSFYDLPFSTSQPQTFLVRQKMVSANAGISFWSSCVTQVIPSPNIRYVPLADPFGPWNAYLYWRKEHPLTEQETVFKDFVEEYYQTLHNF